MTPSSLPDSRAPASSRVADIGLTALAPAVWGSTYLVTTQWLPQGYPLTLALLRALPAGLLLLLWARRLPQGIWWARILLLGACNFTLFWAFLFVAAYRLPGGVAATLGAMQPLLVLVLAHWLLRSPLRLAQMVAALVGLLGVGLLVLTSAAQLDVWGVAAGLGSAVSMAFGTVLSRRWQPPVPALTFTAWQLVAGGVLLLPAVLWWEPVWPQWTSSGVLAMAYLCVIGAAASYVLWFRGLARLGPQALAPLGFLSPVTAVLLGAVALGQSLTLWQWLGMVLVLGSVAVAQRLR